MGTDLTSPPPYSAGEESGDEEHDGSDASSRWRHPWQTFKGLLTSAGAPRAGRASRHGYEYGVTRIGSPIIEDVDPARERGSRRAPGGDTKEAGGTASADRPSG